jgi:hypothetical protein
MKFPVNKLLAGTGVGQVEYYMPECVQLSINNHLELAQLLRREGFVIEDGDWLAAKRNGASDAMYINQYVGTTYFDKLSGGGVRFRQYISDMFEYIERRHMK